MSQTVFIKDKNLKPENIKKGVKILKTEGTYEGGSSADLGKLVETVTDNTRYVFDASDYGKDGFNAVIIDVSVASSGGADPLLTVIVSDPRTSNVFCTNDSSSFTAHYEEYTDGGVNFFFHIVTNELDSLNIEIDGDDFAYDDDGSLSAYFEEYISAEPGSSYSETVVIYTDNTSMEVEISYDNNMVPPAPLEEECPQCGGTGTDPNTGETCEMCGGSGYIEEH